MPTKRAPLPLGQPTITTFLSGYSNTCATEKASAERRKIYSKQFRDNFKSRYPLKTFLGEMGGYLYYRDEGFYNFEAYDPVTAQQVGTLNIEQYYEINAISNIEVDVAYRRRKIGLRLVMYANTTTGRRLVAFYSRDKHTRYCLTDEGYRLILACIDRGVFAYEQLLVGGSIPPSPGDMYNF